VTEYARRDDNQYYIIDRVSRNTSYEVLNDGHQNIFSLRDDVSDGSGQLRVIGLTRNYYDGDAFVDLPFGSIGDFGALVRTESLAFTDDFLNTVFNESDPLSISSLPCYLALSTPVNWRPEYPFDFSASMPELGRLCTLHRNRFLPDH